MYRLPRVEQEQPAVVPGSGHHALVERVYTQAAHRPLMLQHFQRTLAFQVMNYDLFKERSDFLLQNVQCGLHLHD